MKQKEVIHTLILIFTIVLGFAIPKSQLVNYDLEITAALFIFFFLTKRFFLKKTPLLESVIFTLTITLIVNSTGGTNSPFFFLIYFLLFSLSLLLEPVISLTASLTFIIFFLISLPKSDDFKHLLPVFSLAFLTPFSLYLGQEYLQLQKEKQKLAQTKEETFLFLSLIIKKHLETIKEATENFTGDHHLNLIKKTVLRLEKLIEKFERSQ